MLLNQLEKNLDKLFCKRQALEWDNVGLQVGSLSQDIRKIFVTLDVNSSSINEAIDTNSDLIFSHHPLIFKPIYRVVDSDYAQNLVKKLIGEDISLYCAHTNYDLMCGGLNDFLAEKLYLNDTKIIEEEGRQWYKFVVFVPEEAEEEVRNAICKNGGGSYKNYSCCTFNTKGVGTFRPLEGSKPFSGKVGKLNFEQEIKIECIVDGCNKDNIIQEVLKVHPYEEVAYDIFKIENKLSQEGIGRLGSLKQSMFFGEFLLRLKEIMGIRNFRWISEDSSSIKNKKIKRVALSCGSANSLTRNLVGLDCDIVVVGEIGYHNALEIINSGKVVVALGHSNSEKYAIDDIYSKLESYFKNQEIKIVKSKKGYTTWRYYID
ncbi:MAG: Nif3-like dinuclear metal center hexameric protein [Actinomycetota bacterium]